MNTSPFLSVNYLLQIIENLRRLTRALRPIYLEDLGLVTAVEMLARETSQNNQQLVVNFQKTGQEGRLAPEVELSLYRIAQELLNNVVKHSEATHADLKITFGPSEKSMEVIDYGSGFQVPKSPAELAPDGHFGLLGIRERADLIEARLEIESAPGKGTRLSVRLRSDVRHKPFCPFSIPPSCAHAEAGRAPFSQPRRSSAGNDISGLIKVQVVEKNKKGGVPGENLIRMVRRSRFTFILPHIKYL